MTMTALGLSCVENPLPVTSTSSPPLSIDDERDIEKTLCDVTLPHDVRAAKTKYISILPVLVFFMTFYCACRYRNVVLSLKSATQTSETVTYRNFYFDVSFWDCKGQVTTTFQQQLVHFCLLMNLLFTGFRYYACNSKVT